MFMAERVTDSSL